MMKRRTSEVIRANADRRASFIRGDDGAVTWSERANPYGSSKPGLPL